MVEYFRVLKLLNYSNKAFEITELFEYIELPSGILCSEEMCPDFTNHNIRIAFLIAIGEYEQLQREFDYLISIEYFKYLQSAI